MSSGQSNSFFYVLDEPMNVLFVDDDPILREFALVHLASDTAGVELAEHGQAALDILATRPIDLILLDLEMPVMDGFEVLSRLRADPLTRDLPVIVCTGREDIQAIDRAFQLGATSFVVKPVNWRLLTHQIRYVFRAQRQEHASAADLRALMQASQGLLAQAARGDADMRRSAMAFARALEQVVEPAAAPLQAAG